MTIKEIQWDDTSVTHIARHGVEPQEVEEVCFQGAPLVLKARLNRYFALGKAQNGRYLTIIFEYLGHGKAQVITARAMSEAERNLYRRR